MLQLHQAARATILNAQKALVRIRFAISAAHRLEFLRAHALAALERERGQATFHRHHEHVLAAILAPHVTLAAIEPIVRAAHERRRGRVRRRLGIAVRLALGRRRAIGQRDGHDARAARLAFQIAQRMVGVAVRAANRTGRVIGVRALLGALEHGRFQFRAGANVGQRHAASVQTSELTNW